MPPITCTGPLALFLDAADRGPWTKAPLDLRASLNELVFTQFSSVAEKISLFTSCPNLSLNLQPAAPEIGSYAMSERGRCCSTAVNPGLRSLPPPACKRTRHSEATAPETGK